MYHLLLSIILIFRNARLIIPSGLHKLRHLSDLNPRYTAEDNLMFSALPEYCSKNQELQTIKIYTP